MKKINILSNLKSDANLWDDFAFSYHNLISASLHTRGNWYSKKLIPTVLSLLRKKKESKVLDFGCGNGYLAGRISALGYEIVGYDISKNMLQLAREKNPTIDFLADVKKIFKQKYSSIILNMVIQDVRDYQVILSKLIKILDDDGQIILSIPHPCFCNSADGVKEVRKYKSRYSFYKFNENSVGVKHYHRSLEEYFSVFYAKGFYLSFFKEIYDRSMGEVPHCVLVVFKKLVLKG